MGYYTDYTLTADCDADTLRTMLNTATTGGGNLFTSFMEEYANPTRWNYHGKWYDYKIDFRYLSKTYPDVLLTLEGNGEEGGDLWRMYAKGGKTYQVHARIVFEEFDEEKLA